MGRHAAEPRRINLRNELRFVRNYWSYYKHYKRGRRHPWPVDLALMFATTISQYFRRG